MPVRERIFPIAVLIGLIAVLLGVRITTHPSLNRDWSPDHALTPKIVIGSDAVAIRDIRNTDPGASGNRTPLYFDRTYALSSLRAAWLVVENRGGPGAAQLRVSFEFDGPEYLVLSPEARLERGETYSPLRGLLRRYELAYFAATETDVLRHAANDLGRAVYLYEIRSDPARTRELFIDMCARARSLDETPEFYHTIFNNVTGNLFLNFGTITRRGALRALFVTPTKAERHLYAARVLNHNVPFELLRGRAYITDLSRTWQPGTDYSDLIRRQTRQSNVDE